MKSLNKITNTTFQRDTDPKHYHYLYRLTEGDEIKKKERLDGKKVINEFILERDSLQQDKSKRKY